MKGLCLPGENATSSDIHQTSVDLELKGWPWNHQSGWLQLSTTRPDHRSGVRRSHPRQQAVRGDVKWLQGGKVLPGGTCGVRPHVLWVMNHRSPRCP